MTYKLVFSLIFILVNLFFDNIILSTRQRKFRNNRFDLICLFQVSLLSDIKL